MWNNDKDYSLSTIVLNVHGTSELQDDADTTSTAIQAIANSMQFQEVSGLQAMKSNELHEDTMQCRLPVEQDVVVALLGNTVLHICFLAT